MSPFLLWAQQAPMPEGAAPTPAPVELPSWLQWLLVWGDPRLTDARTLIGPFLTWAKVVGLVALVSWIVYSVIRALRDSTGKSLGRNAIFVGTLFGLLVVSVLIQVLERLERLKLGSIGSVPISGALTALIGLVLLAWVERVLWRNARRTGEGGGSVPLLVGLHLALLGGLLVAFKLPAQLVQNLSGLPGWQGAVTEGLTIGSTFAGLVVLVYATVQIFREVSKLRWRRIYTIAWHTVVEAFRRMWAPWVVLALFLVVLAFTHWFLGGTRVAELAKVFVGTLTVVLSLLLTLMILILAPISIPNDIRQQTIYTVVTKPVRRLELIWGRLVGYMALVTVLLLLFGGVSLFYLERVVRSQIPASRARAQAALEAGRVDEAKMLVEQANQLETRMSARVPMFGSLTFTDSKGVRRAKGIDVGMEQFARSHIEGATPSMATWRFGVVEDPMRPGVTLDRRLPVDKLLQPGTLEYLENEVVLLQDDRARLQAGGGPGKQTQAEIRRVNEELRRSEERLKSLEAELATKQQKEKDLQAQLAKLDRTKNAAEVATISSELRALHSPPIPIEMTFNIYRTTKGELGQAVRASVVVSNPSGKVEKNRQLFEIHEYYTIRKSFPARMLVGSRGNLSIDVQCVTPAQYLGMAEDDLYVLAAEGPFWANFLRGLTGLWLQALVLISIGLFAGTFLSWPVALLLTLAFYLAGQVAIGFLQQYVGGLIAGGGPFESLIRLLSHNNQVSELDPTLGVVLAKTGDSIVMPVLSRLSYLIPNLSALDTSNKVALGYAVDNGLLFGHLLMGLGYAIPFTIAAYLILKKREVAA